MKNQKQDGSWGLVTSTYTHMKNLRSLKKHVLSNAS